MVSPINETQVLELSEKLFDYKGNQVKTYDVNKVIDYTSYIIIVTANSSPHAKALFMLVHDYFKSLGVEPFVRHKKLEQRQWIVCDYVDLVVHILLEEEREFYKLEQLFGEGKLIFDKTVEVETFEDDDNLEDARTS